MNKKVWKVFLIFTLVFGMTVSFGTSKAEAEEPVPTVSAETTEVPQASAVPTAEATVNPTVSPETTGTPVATAESTAAPVTAPEVAVEPTQTPEATEEPVETEAPVAQAERLAVNTDTEESAPTATPGEDNTPKAYDLSGDQKDWVQSFSLEAEDSDGTYKSLDQVTSIPEYASFKLNVTFQVPVYQDGTAFPGIQDTDTIQFKLPEGIRSFSQTSGTIRNASWHIENGSVVLKFNPDFLAQNNRYGASGSLSLEGTFNDRITEGGGTNLPVIRFLGNEYGNYSVVKRTDGIGNIDLKKTAVSKTHQDNNELGAVQSAHYQIQAKAGNLENENSHNNEDLHNVVINDAFTTYEKYAFDAEDYVKESDFEKYISYQNVVIKITGPEGEHTVYQSGTPVDDPEGRSVSVIDGTDSAHKSFRLNGSLHPDEIIVIDYDAEIDEEMYEDEPHGFYQNKVNDKNITKSGNAAVNGKDGGAERSWIDRRVGSTASVKADGTVGDTDNCEKQNSTDGDWFLTFKKTWLYTGADEGPDGGPHSGHISNLQISVNEGDRMPLGGYLLEDDLMNQTKPQQLISGITVTDEDNNRAVVDSISLNDLKTGVTSGKWAGSSVNKIQYTFPEGMNHHYRFHFITQGDKDKTEDIQAYNTVTLKEPSQKGTKYDDYGAAKEWTTKGATVTKRYVSTDTDNSTIQWQTTIDDGIDVEQNSHYDDYVYWERTDRSYKKDVEYGQKDTDGNFTDTKTESKGTEDKDFHQLNAETLNLKITAGEDHVELQNNVDYKVEFLSDETVNNAISSYWNHGLTSGFRITFLRKVEHGPVIITYSSKAAFNKVNYQEKFSNIAKYWVKDDSNPFTAEDNVCFEANGSLKKAVESNDGNRIQWSLRINDKKNPTAAGYTVEDTIPEGLNFDLHDLEPAELYCIKGSDSNFCDNSRLTGSFDKNSIVTDGSVQTYTGTLFDATYDKTTGKLRIDVHPDASNRIFTKFLYTTTVSAKALKKSIDEKQKVEFRTPAKLYSNGTGTPEIAESDAWAWIEADTLSKTETYNQTTAPYVNYRITVNSKEAELAPEKHEVYVQDSGMQAPLIFQHGSLKITDKYNNSYTEGTEADADKHTYAFESTENGGFKIIVPDKTALTISYSAYAPGVSGDELNTSNGVSLYADGTEFQHTSAGNEREDWVKPSLSVKGTTRIQIRKSDSNNKALKGAVFGLFDTSGSDYLTGTEIGEFTSDQNGIAYTSNDKDGYAHLSLETGKVYLIKEIKAPAYKDNDAYYKVNPDYVRKFYITNGTDKSSDPEIQNMRNNGVLLINDGVQMELDDCIDSEINTTTIKATKVWDDNNNQDGIRKDVTLHLNAKAGDQDVSSFIQSEDLEKKIIKADSKDLTVEWKNLPVTDSEGNEITYTVTEDPMDGYTPAVTGDQKNGFTVTNSHTPVTTEVSGTKIWNDAEYLNQNGYERPESIEVSVTGTVDGRTVETQQKTVTKDDHWTYTFDKLPKYHDGKEITYVVSETKVGDKTPSEAAYVSEVSENGRDITNTPKSSEKEDLTSVKLTIIKRDRKSAKHALLKDTTFQLKKDDSDQVVSGTTDENGQVTLNIPEAGNYTLTETKAPEGYTISDEMQKGLKVEVTKSDTDKVELNVENNENVFTKAKHLILGEKDHFTYGFDEKTDSGVVEVSNDPITKDIHTEKVIDNTPKKEKSEPSESEKTVTPAKSTDTVLHLNKTVAGKTETAETKTVHTTEKEVIWKDQPVYEDGHKITYTVTEEPVKGHETVEYVVKNTPVSKEDRSSETPDTADHTNIPWSAGMLGGSVLVLCTILMFRRRYN